MALALNNNETQLIGLTDTLQLVVHSLKDSGSGSGSSQTGMSTLTATGMKVKSHDFAILCYPFHNGAITGMDVCQRKPLGNMNFFFRGILFLKCILVFSGDMWSRQDDPRLELPNLGNGIKQRV